MIRSLRVIVIGNVVLFGGVFLLLFSKHLFASSEVLGARIDSIEEEVLLTASQIYGGETDGYHFRLLSVEGDRARAIIEFDNDSLPVDLFFVHVNGTWVLDRDEIINL